MPDQINDVVVLGAGISGLSAAWALHQKGKSFVVLERNHQVGGVLQTSRADGYQFERGANSMVMTPFIDRLISDLGLTDEIVHATPASKQRYLLWNDKLHGLKPSPLSLIGSKLLSFGGKWSILKDLRTKSRWQEGESVHQFFERRFGNEVATRILGAVINGIYAGDPKQLEMESIFPQLIEMESEHGSIIRGMKNRVNAGSGGRVIMNLNGGMSSLLNALSSRVDRHIQLNTSVLSIRRREEYFEIEVSKGTEIDSIKTKQIISTLPAYALSPLIQPIDLEMSGWLEGIPYNPMLVFHVGYPNHVLEGVANGFGFLASSEAEERFIGVMWNSNVFPDVAPEGQTLSSFFVRPTQEDLEMDPEKLFRTRCKPKMKRWTGIDTNPCFLKWTKWDMAIPQKVIGHQKLMRKIETFEENHPGLKIGGNYRSGVSVGDCIEYHVGLVERSLE